MTVRVTTRPRPVVRLPLRCSLDLTYRCNHHCLHCWLWQPASSSPRELRLDEIQRIADDARALGTRDWFLSGGEPLLRPDFPDIFDHLSHHARACSLNTNATLITPAIAQLLRRPGARLIPLYGATAEVHDLVTKNPGSFHQFLRGLAYLREARVAYTLQLIPMRANFHQWPQMLQLAQTLTPHWRIGAAWLRFNADRDPLRNHTIAAQRLDPADVVALDPPFMPDDLDKTPPAMDINPDPDQNSDTEKCSGLPGTASRPTRLVPAANGPEMFRPFAACAVTREEAHIDPSGGLSFCAFIKDPAFRYDLRTGTFRDGWENFIPSLADKTTGCADACAACDLRDDCRRCPAHSWLEHGDYAAKVGYLCNVARETRHHKQHRRAHHRRLYRVGGITLQIDADLPFAADTVAPRFDKFRVEAPGNDVVAIHHHFSLAGLPLDDLGEKVAERNSWTIHRKSGAWIYRSGADGETFCVGVFNSDYSRGRVYHASDADWRRGNLAALSLPPTDQILLARLLAERRGCVIHSAAAILAGRGLLFVGESDAGKTTTTRLIEPDAEILCDDRNVVRRLDDGFRLFGTWSHGESPRVSAADAPLNAILFLQKADANRLVPLANRADIVRRLTPRVIKSFEGGDWWPRTFDTLEALAREVPCFEMQFDKSGSIVPLLRKL